ncbi:TRAP transporter large permease [Benzoatithermus flavus]|uniref:TRAP transporter large permease protein n=1 Tax=Benzoatithermus flavus TaxID=3108223 RepID=A0ABU8XXZ8_9PROT
MIDTTGELLALGLFASLCGTLMLGFPVAFTLAGTSLLFAAIGYLLGHFDPAFFLSLAPRYFGVMTSETLVAVPLFVFMGFVLERSRIAEELLQTLGVLFGNLRGGLGYAVVLVGAVLAASTGVVGAVVVTMSLISLPTMLRAGYDPKLATGIICASATLAQIIPPSTVLVFVADILQGVNQAAQLRLGNQAPEPVSVGDLFAGAFLPGFVLVALLLLWVAFHALVDPASCPPLALPDAERWALRRRVVVALVFPSLLIVSVLGSILAGIATATESASLGASGALLFAALRGRLSLGLVREASLRTALTTSMIFVILLGASVFSLVFRGLGGEALVEESLRAMPGGRIGAMAVFMAVMFVLGFFLDTFEIVFVMVPIFGPPLLVMGCDPLWLGVMIGLNLQTSFLTPPFGATLFYMRSAAPPAIPTGTLWRGVVVPVALQLLTLLLVWLFPALATWLPKVVFG